MIASPVEPSNCMVSHDGGVAQHIHTNCPPQLCLFAIIPYANALLDAMLAAGNGQVSPTQDPATLIRALRDSVACCVVAQELRHRWGFAA